LSKKIVTENGEAVKFSDDCQYILRLKIIKFYLCYIHYSRQLKKIE